MSSLSIHVVDDQLTGVESPVSNDGEPASLGCGVVSEISAVCDLSSDGESVSLSFWVVSMISADCDILNDTSSST